jgi:hypothetical protein
MLTYNDLFMTTIQMNVRRTKQYIATILAGSLLLSCAQESATEPAGEMATLRVQVNVTDTAAVSGKVAQRSPVSTRAFSDQTLTDLHVFVCQSTGELTGQGYVTGSSISTLATRSGNGCTVYAITNTGDEDLSLSGGMPTIESEIKELTTPSLGSMDDIQADDHLIMSGTATVDIAAGSNTLSDLSVRRLAAKNVLNITCTGGVTLTGYAIGDLPAKSWYMARPNTNENVAADAVAGDDAVDPSTAADWITTATRPASDIATGTTPPYALTFYMYENRPGGRVAVGGSTGDESDPSQKETYAPARATYVDLHVEAEGTGITHRLYLGGTPYATNYNVKRNCSYTYNISISANGGLTVSSINVQDWITTTGGSANF